MPHYAYSDKYGWSFQSVSTVAAPLVKYGVSLLQPELAPIWENNPEWIIVDGVWASVNYNGVADTPAQIYISRGSLGGSVTCGSLMLLAGAAYNALVATDLNLHTPHAAGAEIGCTWTVSAGDGIAVGAWGRWPVETVLGQHIPQSVVLEGIRSWGKPRSF